MKKFLSILGAMTVGMTLLTSCSSKNNKREIKKVPLSEISASETSTEKYSNLVVDKVFKMPVMDKLYTFSIKAINEYDLNENSEVNKALKKEFMDFIKNYSGRQIDESEIEFDVYDIGDKEKAFTLNYTDISENMFYNYAPNRGFTISKTDAANDVHNGECLSYTFIQNGRNIALGSEIPGFTASEAVEMCQKELVDKIISYIPEDELIPHSIASYKFDDCTMAYCIIFAKKFCGLTLSDAGEYGFIDTGFIKPTYLCVQIDSEKNIYSAVNYYPNVYEPEQVKEIGPDEFISPDDALWLLSDYLAEFKQYTVQSMDATYFLPTKMKEDQRDLIYTEYVPGYEVVLESAPSSQHCLFPRKTAYIDVVSGKIYITDSVEQIKFFELD